MPNYQVGELFSGPGGLAYARKQARVVADNGEVFKMDHAWANDIDIAACKTYLRNICLDGNDTIISDLDKIKDINEIHKILEQHHIYHQDVRELEIENLAHIDGLVFGFPCNDFSMVGEQKGLEGKYGPLYSYGVKVLEIHQPDWFVAENVGGLKSANGGQALNKILDDLTNAGERGYNIVPHLYKFEDYGVPQARHRIIIVGIRKDLPYKFEVPAPTVQNSEYMTVREVFENNPLTKDAYNHDVTKHPDHIIERLNAIPPGENAWYEGIPQHLRLNVKGARLSNIYKRLHPDRPAYTVTGSGGGGTHMYHYAEPRALTNRERARLQTFPDGYKFLGSKEEVRKQIGMAVPPKGAEIIFEALLKTLAGIPYENVPAHFDIESLLEE